jgi:hypothetical protein
MQARDRLVGGDVAERGGLLKRRFLLGFLQMHLAGAQHGKLGGDPRFQPLKRDGIVGQIVEAVNLAQTLRLTIRAEQAFDEFGIFLEADQTREDAGNPAVWIILDASEQSHGLGGVDGFPEAAVEQAMLDLNPAIHQITTSARRGKQRLARSGRVFAELLNLLGDRFRSRRVPGALGFAHRLDNRRGVKPGEPIRAQCRACTFIHKMLGRGTLRLIILVPRDGTRGGEEPVFARHGQGIRAEAVLHGVEARALLTFRGFGAGRFPGVLTILRRALLGGEAHGRVRLKGVARPAHTGLLIRHYREKSRGCSGIRYYFS